MMTRASKSKDDKITALELADRSGESYHTIDHWAKSRLLPYRKKGRTRFFLAADSLWRCKRIRELQEEEFNLAAIRKMLSDGE